MRVLVCEGDAVDALALERALAPHGEVRVVATLADAERLLEHQTRPDAIVTSFELPDARGTAVIERLRRHAAGVPIIVSSGQSPETIRRQIEALATPPRADRDDALAVLRTVIHQQQLVHQTIAASRSQILAELERISRDAAEAAVSQALERLMQRLGLEDVEGVRLAVRFARAWEAAKHKFVSALATGIASAFLLALGAGLMALIKSGSNK
ncbi:MAG: response regulator [Geminicoccaceae bacterium]|nr:response regulator [Geminicoccaceae bacterium]MCS7269058.1 response regulator [Geminicoccaceae bacterium]MCX7629113.1 response regulator [Geminicoccaceae bacterium]MDW8124875.1 response regulator [Geminicoccaceae bacterium]MDW8342394.1 response regulator [Geminicoccaceae bacterium]